MKWIFLGSAILGEIVGTTALKYSEGFSKLWPSLVTVGAYVLAFFFLSLTLKEIPVAIAYAIWSGVGIILISLIGFFVFNQPFDGPGVAGMALILAGVVVINLFSKMANH